MPKPLNTDWNLVQALWLQGFNPTQISEKTGLKLAAIKSRAYRFKWNDLKSKTKAFLKAESEPGLAMAVAKDLAEQSKRAKEELANVVADQIKLLKANPAKTLAKLSGKNGLAATTQTIVNTAAKLHSWDSQGNRSLIQIGTLNQLKLDGSVMESSEQVVNPSSEQSEAIDV